MRKISICLCLAMVLSLLVSFNCFAASEKVTVILDGQEIMFPDAQPFINADSRTMVPVRFVSEALGAEVTWIEDRPSYLDGELSQSVVIEKNGINISLTIGENMVYNSTKENGIELDTVPIILNDRTFVPLRFVSEALGCFVDWEGDTNTVRIESKEIVMSLDDWGDNVSLDNTETEKVFIISTSNFDINLEIEKGDTVTSDDDHVVVHKRNGIIYEIFPANFLLDEQITRYKIIIPRSADYKEVITDLSDEYLFKLFGKYGCYLVSEIIGDGLRNGIGETKELSSYSYYNIFIYDGENNTIVIEQK